VPGYPSHFLVRFTVKIQVGDPVQCWPWIGAISNSGKCRSQYGAFQEGGRGSRIWRAHRLSLLLATLPEDLRGDELLSWIYLADLAHADLEAAHQCDTPICCNPQHLEWEPHDLNVQFQWWRQRRIE